MPKFIIEILDTNGRVNGTVRLPEDEILDALTSLHDIGFNVRIKNTSLPTTSLPPKTDHSAAIQMMREVASSEDHLDLFLAADLLEAHDETGISLDNWSIARKFVQRALDTVHGGDIQPNHA